MRLLVDFSEAIIQRYCSEESFRRGQELRTEVAGSQFAPYSVRVVLDETGIVDASCGCRYDWGGMCKHIVAILLARVADAAVESHPDWVVEARRKEAKEIMNVRRFRNLYNTTRKPEARSHASCETLRGNTRSKRR